MNDIYNDYKRKLIAPPPTAVFDEQNGHSKLILLGGLKVESGWFKQPSLSRVEWLVLTYSVDFGCVSFDTND